MSVGALDSNAGIVHFRPKCWLTSSAIGISQQFSPSVTPRYDENMTKNGVLLFIGIVVSIVIAWFLVGALFSVVWFVFRLAVVAVVAIVVFFALRALLKRNE